MIQVSAALRSALDATANQPVDLYELQLVSGTRYYSTEDITWGGHRYLPYVDGRSSIQRSDGPEFDSVTVTFSNVDTAIAQILTTEEVEGQILIIRKIDRQVSDDSLVLFYGMMERASKIDEKSAEISAKQIIGSIEHECPSRRFPLPCPFPFKSEECGYLGIATECNKSWARCSQLGQTNNYGGFRFVPHSGTYSYQVEERKRFLLFFSRKSKKTVTATFSSVDDSSADIPIPIALGRVQLTGVPIQHEDSGSQTTILAAFAVGPILNFTYCRANGTLVADWTGHHGQNGGTATQLVDPRFPGGYPYHLVAYIGVTIPSEVTTEDPAPTIDAVVMGSLVTFRNADGSTNGFGWTDNPVWNTRHFMSLPLQQGGMGIPTEWFDDAVTLESVAYSDELIEDATNGQTIFEPVALPSDIVVGEDYKRYQSTGVDGADPLVDGPYETYEPGVNDDSSVTPTPIQIKRFTMNVAIAKAEAAVDILYKKLLPSFRGYITFSKAGKIQIRIEKPVANTAIAEARPAGSLTFFVDGPAFSAGDRILMGALTANAEVLTVASHVGQWITATAPSLRAHAAGDQVHKIEMAFDDSNIVGGFEYPLSDRQASTNRIVVKYVDAPAGFEARELHVNDYEHQAKIHKVNSEDLDGSAIDNYSQAWRIGQWRRAKLRDLGKFCSFTADIKASTLEVGDVIAVSATETGLRCVPFRIIELAFAENDEVSITGQLYSLSIYDDSAPQATVRVPSIFAPVLPVPAQGTIGDNLLANPSFEAGLVRWTGYDAGVSTTREDADSGARSLKIVATPGTQEVHQPEEYQDGGTDVLPCKPGDIFRFRGRFRFAPDSTVESAQARIAFYAADGTYSSTSASFDFDPAIVAWSDFELVGTAPAGAAYVLIFAFFGRLTAGALFLDTLSAQRNAGLDGLGLFRPTI